MTETTPRPSTSRRGFVAACGALLGGATSWLTGCATPGGTEKSLASQGNDDCPQCPVDVRPGIWIGDGVSNTSLLAEGGDSFKRYLDEDIAEHFDTTMPFECPDKQGELIAFANLLREQNNWAPTDAPKEEAFRQAAQRLIACRQREASKSSGYTFGVVGATKERGCQPDGAGCWMFTRVYELSKSDGRTAPDTWTAGATVARYNAEAGKNEKTHKPLGATATRELSNIQVVAIVRTCRSIKSS